MMKVTYYGHSCFAAQVADKTLLFDPFITGNELAKAIDVKSDSGGLHPHLARTRGPHGRRGGHCQTYRRDHRLQL